MRHLQARGADLLRDGDTIGTACAHCSLQMVRELLDMVSPQELYSLFADGDDNPMAYALVYGDEFRPEFADLLYERGCRFAGMRGEHKWRFNWWEEFPECHDEPRTTWLEQHGAFADPLESSPAAWLAPAPPAEPVRRNSSRLNAAFLKACHHGHLKEARRLAGQGADLECRGELNKTPLMLAAICGSLPLVSWLLDAGADVNARDYFGETPLMMCNAAVGMLLLERGAQADAVSRRGVPPMHCHPCPEILHRLRAMGCPLEHATGDGLVPLDEHMLHGDFDVTARVLLGMGASPEGAGSGGPLQKAADCWRIKTMRVLLRAGANPNSKRPFDLSTPLHEACGFTALNPEYGYCAVNHDPAVLRLLLDAGADPNARNEYMRTPLMNLCSVNLRISATPSPAHVRVLLDYGADPALEDLHGRTAAEMARDNGLVKIAAMLEKHMAAGC